MKRPVFGVVKANSTAKGVEYTMCDYHGKQLYMVRGMADSLRQLQEQAEPGARFYTVELIPQEASSA